MMHEFEETVGHRVSQIIKEAEDRLDLFYSIYGEWDGKDSNKNKRKKSTSKKKPFFKNVVDQKPKKKIRRFVNHLNDDEIEFESEVTLEEESFDSTETVIEKSEKKSKVPKKIFKKSEDDLEEGLDESEEDSEDDLEEGPDESEEDSEDIDESEEDSEDDPDESEEDSEDIDESEEDSEDPDESEEDSEDPDESEEDFNEEDFEESDFRLLEDLKEDEKVPIDITALMAAAEDIEAVEPIKDIEFKGAEKGIIDLSNLTASQIVKRIEELTGERITICIKSKINIIRHAGIILKNNGYEMKIK